MSRNAPRSVAAVLLAAASLGLFLPHQASASADAFEVFARPGTEVDACVQYTPGGFNGGIPCLVFAEPVDGGAITYLAQVYATPDESLPGVPYAVTLDLDAPAGYWLDVRGCGLTETFGETVHYDAVPPSVTVFPQYGSSWPTGSYYCTIAYGDETRMQGDVTFSPTMPDAAIEQCPLGKSNFSSEGVGFHRLRYYTGTAIEGTPAREDFCVYAPDTIIHTYGGNDTVMLTGSAPNATVDVGDGADRVYDAADGAALAGAQSVDEESIYLQGLPSAGPIPLDERAAERAVRDYLANAGLLGPRLNLEISTTGTTVSVALAARIELPVTSTVTAGSGGTASVSATATARTAVMP